MGAIQITAWFQSCQP